MFPCALCGLPIVGKHTSVWLPQLDMEEETHEECADFFLASRPNADERRKRWLEQKGEEQCNA